MLKENKVSSLDRNIVRNVNKSLAKRFGEDSWGDPVVGVESFEVKRYELEFRIIDEESDEDDTRNVRGEINTEVGVIIAETLNKMIPDLVKSGIVEKGHRFYYNSFSDKGWYSFDL